MDRTKRDKNLAGMETSGADAVNRNQKAAVRLRLGKRDIRTRVASQAGAGRMAAEAAGVRWRAAAQADAVLIAADLGGAGDMRGADLRGAGWMATNPTGPAGALWMAGRSRPR